MEMPYRSGCDLHVHSGTATGKRMCVVWCGVVRCGAVRYAVLQFNMLSYVQKPKSNYYEKRWNEKKNERNLLSQTVCVLMRSSFAQ